MKFSQRIFSDSNLWRSNPARLSLSALSKGFFCKDLKKALLLERVSASQHGRCCSFILWAPPRDHHHQGFCHKKGRLSSGIILKIYWVFLLQLEVSHCDSSEFLHLFHHHHSILWIWGILLSLFTQNKVNSHVYFRDQIYNLVWFVTNRGPSVHYWQFRFCPILGQSEPSDW